MKRESAKAKAKAGMGNRGCGESVKKPELKSLNREGAKIAKRPGLFYAIGNDHLKARVTGKQMLCIGLDVI